MTIETTKSVFTTGHNSYKIIASYQYRENYGAHSWDGEGECPQYWKMKGEHTEILADGITSEMLADEVFMASLKKQGVKLQENNDYCETWFCRLDIVPSGLWLDERLVEDPYEPAYWHPEHQDAYDRHMLRQFECNPELWETYEQLAEMIA